ncbi:MAG: hypothetical protein KDD33_01765 [Bdellovibrionales bacterium]|nr:hypothetical protein [Bdellovibrionales bacterium]
MARFLIALVSLFIVPSALADHSDLYGDLLPPNKDQVRNQRKFYKTDKGREIEVIDGDGQKTPESQGKKPELTVVEGGKSKEGDQSAFVDTEGKYLGGRPEKPGAAGQGIPWGDHVPGPQPTIPPVKFGGLEPQTEAIPIKPKDKIVWGDELPPHEEGAPPPIYRDRTNTMGEPEPFVPYRESAENQNGDRPWMDQPGTTPMRFIEMTRLFKLESIATDKNVQMTVMAAIGSAMLMNLWRLMVMSRGNAAVAGAIAILPPEYSRQIMKGLGAKEQYILPANDKYSLEDVLEFIQENRGEKAISLEDLEPEFAKYLYEVLTAVEAQDFHKAYLDGRAA